MGSSPKLVGSIECTKVSSRVRFSPDGALLAVQDGDGLVAWDVKEAKISGRWKAVCMGGMDFIFTPDGKNILLGNDANVQSLDLRTGLSSVVYQHPGGVISLAYSPKDQIVASSAGKSVKLWDVAAAKELKTIEEDEVFQGLTFSPDGKTLIGAGGNSAVPAYGRIWLWDVAGVQKPRKLEGYKYTVEVLALSPDGKTLATRGEDWDVWLWDVEQGTIKAKWKPGFSGVHALAFSSDGRTLAVGGGSGNPPGIHINSGMVSFWDTGTGKELKSFVALDDMVRSIALSPDGTKLAVSNDQSLKTVKVWDVSQIVIRP
jgi:WD40 repeat protein